MSPPRRPIEINKLKVTLREMAPEEFPRQLVHIHTPETSSSGRTGLSVTVATDYTQRSSSEVAEALDACVARTATLHVIVPSRRAPAELR